MSIQNVLPPGFTYKLKKSKKSGEYLGIFYRDGTEYCRGEVDLTEGLANSSASITFLKYRQKETVDAHNATLGGIGAAGGVKAGPLMSGKVAPSPQPVNQPLPQAYTKGPYPGSSWDPNGSPYLKPKRKPAGMRTFSCELQVSAAFDAGADATTFCNDLSAALKVLMRGRSAQIAMSNIKEK